MSVIKKILSDAWAAKATDVHLSAGARPRMRVSGQLLEMDYSRLNAQDTLDFVLQYMTQTQRDLLEERGMLCLALTFPNCGRVRVMAYKQCGTMALACRLFGEKIPTPEEIGVLDGLLEQCESKSGLVLVAGEAGSGKSTTLASLLQRINETRAVHIMTLERPVEYILSHKMAVVNQVEVGLDTLGFTESLSEISKQNVDVLLVGELREASAIEEAVKAAEAGVLVFAGVTAKDASSALEQMVDCFEVHRQDKMRKRLMGVLNVAASQKLLQNEDGTQYATYQMLDLFSGNL